MHGEARVTPESGGPAGVAVARDGEEGPDASDTDSGSDAGASDKEDDASSSKKSLGGSCLLRGDRPPGRSFEEGLVEVGFTAVGGCANGSLSHARPSSSNLSRMRASISSTAAGDSDWAAERE